ncbi:MAG: glycoside hydrolase family 9 protein [Candidatus Melainabacteria bacterium]
MTLCSLIRRPFAIPAVFSGLALVALTQLTVDAATLLTPQIPYHAQGPKVAYLKDLPPGVTPSKVILYDPSWTAKWELYKGRVVYKDATWQTAGQGATSSVGPTSGMVAVDFSAYRTPGKYELRVYLPGKKDPVTQPVEISEFAYWDPLKPVLKSFYFQRSGDILKDNRLDFYYYDCYSDENLPLAGSPDERWDAGGGWYDDDHRTKRVLTNSLALGKLLSLYESAQKPLNYLKLDYPYDESNLGSVPDLVLEMKVGLDWLQAMQREDGGVYQAVEGVDACDPDTASQKTTARAVEPVSPKATAAAAAVLAMAGRSLKEKDLGYAVRSMRAAERAWDFLGKQSLAHQREVLPWSTWAAIELSITTSDPKYTKFLALHLPMLLTSHPYRAMDEEHPQNIYLTDYLNYARQTNPQITEAIREQITSVADRLATQVEARPLTAGLTRFGAASNQQVSENIATFMQAYAITHEDRYRQAAVQSLDYLFGMNPIQKSYISGLGDRAVSHLAHARFQEKDKVISGFLVSGPNEKAADAITPKNQGAASYVDDRRALDSNRSNLLYNASLAQALVLLNKAFTEDAPPAPVDPHHPHKPRLD